MVARSSRPGDRPLRVRWRLLAAAAAVVAVALSRLMASFPHWTERAYAESVGPVLVVVLSRLSAVFPFALVEVALGLVILWTAVAAIVVTRDLFRRRRSLRNVLGVGALRTGAGAGIVVALFYLLWGFNYSRAPLPDRLGWNGGLEPGAEELSRLAEEMVLAANEAYLELHGVEDVGLPTPRPDDSTDAQLALDEAWDRARQWVPVPRLAMMTSGPAKRPLLSRAASRLGFAGAYSPFTGEVLVNGDMPAFSLPHTLAHEQAHQKGFAPEDEANFVSFIVGSLSRDDLTRYSAYLFAQSQLLRALRREDPQASTRIGSLRLPGVRRDLRHLRDYWAKYEGAARRTANRVNDIYLKSNRVKGGTRSYERSLLLLMELARRNGDTLRLSGSSAALR